MNKTFKSLIEATTEKAGFKKVKGTGKEYELKNAQDSAFGDYTDKKNDIRITATVHSKSQAKDRRPEYTAKDWENLHKKTCATIDDGGMYDDGWKLFYSKSMKQGYITNLKFVDSSGVLKVTVITVLPKGKNNPQGGNSGGTTELELMESCKNDAYLVALMENIDQLQIIEFD